MIETHRRVGIDGLYLNVKMTTYEKPTANIILMGKNQKCFLFENDSTIW